MTRQFIISFISSVLLSLPLDSIKANQLIWADNSTPITYQMNERTAPVVRIALDMFASDMMMRIGQSCQMSKDARIQIYQLDNEKKSILKKLDHLEIPIEKVSKQMDAFWLGVKNGKIVIVGNNGRGTAYGILELSRMAGVSPWVWWGDVTPSRCNQLTIDDTFETFQAPSVTYRGIFINDEDWSLRNWAEKTFEPNERKGYIGPKTYKEIFKLLLRLRANTIWPAMHEGTTGFFTVKGNREVADSCGILIGSSHCEPLLRNNVAEWDVKKRGAYNYISNGAEVRRYWAERLKEVKGSEELFTIGMRGIHDGSMEGVKTPEEKLKGLQQVIDDQRKLIKKYYNGNVESVPQVFIPYKEVLQIMESGLQVPDDVTLMWCDDNYGYMTRLPDVEQRKRTGGGGVYYHLSYWGRPHDHLWLTTTQPGLIYSEMKTAYDYQARNLWIANVHDPKVAAYDLELFLDMAWNIDAIGPSTIYEHMEKWLTTQFGPIVGRGIAPAMKELYRLNAIRKPEFMGWTQVELNKNKYPGGKSVPTTTEFTLSEAAERLADFAKIETLVDVYQRMVPNALQDAYFAAVLYPVHASAAMSRKMLGDTRQSEQAYQEIQHLTKLYNELSNGKWNGLMSAAPRNLPVFGKCHTEIPQHINKPVNFIAKNASDYSKMISTQGNSQEATAIEILGHSMNAIALSKGNTLVYDFMTENEGEATLYTAMIPTQPNDKGDLRYSVQIDNQQPITISLKEPYRSENWKRNVLRGQALKETTLQWLRKGEHTLRIKALDDHIIVDQWMIDFTKNCNFYVIPTKSY